MSSSRRAVFVGVIWVAATAFALAFAVWTAVGPVVLVLGGGHGVHAGDLIALTAAYSAAAMMTRTLPRRA